MGIFDRMSRLFKSNANAAIDKMSNPAKEVELLVAEMEDQLRLARAETVRIKATEKLCANRVGDLEKQAASWNERAEAALRLGDEELARKALEQKLVVDGELAEARKELRESGEYAARLQDQLKSLDARLKQYRLKKGTIQAKTHMAKKDLKPGTVDSFDEFDRMAGRVDEDEVQVEAERELASEFKTKEDEAQLARRIEKASDTGDVASRLAALKEKMGKKEDA